MAEELGSNAFFRGAGRRRCFLAGAALLALGVLAFVALLAYQLVTGELAVGGSKYVSLIHDGQVQVCRVTPRRVICPPLSSSLSKSYSASRSASESASASASRSRSKSYSASNSISTSTSLSPSVHTQ